MPKFSIEKHSEEILKLHKTHNLTQISKILGVSRSGLSEYFRRNGLEAKKNSKNISEYIEQIKELASQGFHTKSIAEKLNLDVTSVTYRVKKLDLKVRNGKYKINKELSDEIKNLYVQGKSVNQIAEQLRFNPKTIKRSLALQDVTMRTPHETALTSGIRTIDTNAFGDFENDEAAAYWYGWLLADGNLSDKGTVSIGLKGEDGYVLERFKSYLGSSAKVSYITCFHKALNRDVSSASFTFAHQGIVSRLIEQGLEPRKSCKEKLPKFDWLNGKTAAHFWRGMIEGDGCITLSREIHPDISLVGSQEVLEGFRFYAETVCGVKPGKQLRKRNYGNADFRIIEYSGNDCRKIVRNLWSFETDNFLLRKKILADKVIAQPFSNRP